MMTSSKKTGTIPSSQGHLGIQERSFRALQVRGQAGGDGQGGSGGPEVPGGGTCRLRGCCVAMPPASYAGMPVVSPMEKVDGESTVTVCGPSLHSVMPRTSRNVTTSPSSRPCIRPSTVVTTPAAACVMLEMKTSFGVSPLLSTTWKAGPKSTNREAQTPMTSAPMKQMGGFCARQKLSTATWTASEASVSTTHCSQE